MIEILLNMFNSASEFLCGFLTPAMLIICGVFLSLKIKIFRILRPSLFIKTLSDVPAKNHSSPLKALSVALAGTLGVGNITGVSAAIVQGGIGAVFWMWIGALVSMSVKYGEVALAIRYRKCDDKGRFYGGIMYVIRDGLKKYFTPAAAWVFGACFSVLCLINALVTGSIVQSNAAADVLHPLPEWFSGGIVACLTILAVLYGVERLESVTCRLIPVLTGIFVFLSLSVILPNLSVIPSILSEILKDAFSLKALTGGAMGVGIRDFSARISSTGLGKSLRYGITRGIFSNEAGCGTSPTAHASADTKSPFHQGCFGIFEVICDTLVLCTMTAMVICIGDRYHNISGTGAENLTLRVFQIFGGDFVYGLLACMVALFAYATILAQLYYGHIAIGYFTKRQFPVRLYTVLTIVCVWLGAVMDAGSMWRMADTVICTMTCLNIVVLFFMKKEIIETVPNSIMEPSGSALLRRKIQKMK